MTLSRAQPDGARRVTNGTFVARFDPRGDVHPEIMAEVAATLTRSEVTYIASVVPGLVSFRVEPGTEDHAVELASALPGCLYAEREVIGDTARAPNDPWYAPLQWQYNNTGQTINGASGTPGADMRLECAWNVTTKTGDVIIAVLDSGINYLHPDLAANMWINPDEIPNNSIDDDGNGIADDMYGVGIDDCGSPYAQNDPYDAWDYPPSASFAGDHGTACAFFAGGEGHNEMYGTGAAWTTRIMSIRMYQWDPVNGVFCSSLTPAGLVKAFDYAYSKGAKVLNCSFAFEYTSQALKESFEYLGPLDMVAVCCAQNYGIDIDNATPGGQHVHLWPARYKFPHVLVVGASDQLDERAVFSVNPPKSSNYGATTVHVMAPGKNLRIFDGNQGGGQYISGTSFSTPLTAAVLAMVWAEHPTLSNVQVVEKIWMTARPVSALSGLCKSGGVVDAANAMSASCP